MIGYDERHAERGDLLRLLGRRNAVIDRDDEPCSLFVQELDRGGVQSVSLVAARDVPVRFRAERLKIAVQHIGRGDSVAVVIAVNGNFFAVFDRAGNDLDRFFHIRKQKGIGKALAVKKSLRAFAGENSPARENAAYERIQPRFPPKPLRKRGVGFFHDPFFHSGRPFTYNIFLIIA